MSVAVSKITGYCTWLIRRVKFCSDILCSSNIVWDFLSQHIFFPNPYDKRYILIEWQYVSRAVSLVANASSFVAVPDSSVGDDYFMGAYGLCLRKLCVRYVLLLNTKLFLPYP